MFNCRQDNNESIMVMESALSKEYTTTTFEGPKGVAFLFYSISFIVSLDTAFDVVVYFFFYLRFPP